MSHQYQQMSAHGDDSPGKSLDTYSYCFRCGTVKHDYRHNGGMTSPNYPMFLRVGGTRWDATDGPCQAEPEITGPFAHTRITNLGGRPPGQESDGRFIDKSVMPVPDETGLNPAPDAPERDVLKIGKE